jgi:hypothetical protein
MHSQSFKELLEQWVERHERFKEEGIAQLRIGICRACEHRRHVGLTGIWCRRCGCPMHLKTRVMEAKCPLNPPKWDAF